VTKLAPKSAPQMRDTYSSYLYYMSITLSNISGSGNFILTNISNSGSLILAISGSTS